MVQRPHDRRRRARRNKHGSAPGGKQESAIVPVERRELVRSADLLEPPADRSKDSGGEGH